VAICALSATRALATGSAFVDVTDRNLPPPDLASRSMHAAAIDIDRDGDLDIVVAREFQTNIILINNGAGVFSDQSAERLPAATHDSEEVVQADFNGDGYVDLLFVSEDDQVHELFFNDGSGHFSDEGWRIPIMSTANGTAAFDINADGFVDVVIANNGQNNILINDGTGTFRDETATRLPRLADVSQDIEVGDVNGDGYLDLVFANEGPNIVLINDGHGVFADAGGLPDGRVSESRMASLADIDGDGDLDLFIANVAVFVDGVDPKNQLYINDGAGHFTEVTDDRLPRDNDSSFEGKFVDIDADGDLDIIVGNTVRLGGPGDAPVRVLLNTGGTFTEDATILPASANGNVFGIVAADFNGDNCIDLFLALRHGADRLLLGL
jgi:hypothetical protein